VTTGGSIDETSADNEKTKRHPGLTATVRGLVNTVHMASPVWPGHP